MPRRVVFRRAPVVRDQADRNPRRAPRLRARQGIGNFGGETDNWRWPRHTGDFSFYRGYVGSDGKPAPYSKDNVPYRAEALAQGLAEGRRPRRSRLRRRIPRGQSGTRPTRRSTNTSSWELPRSIRRSTEQLAILDASAKSSPEVAIKVETRIRGLNNGLTKNRGVLDGLIKGGALEQKSEMQRKLTAWIERTRTAGRSTATSSPRWRRSMPRRPRHASATRFSPVFAAAAVRARSSARPSRSSRPPLDRPKKDIDREPEFQERNWARTKEARSACKGPSTARWTGRSCATTSRGGAAPRRRADRTDRRAADSTVGMSPDAAGKAIDAFLDKLYAGTKLFDKDYRLALLDKSTKELAAAEDPFLTCRRSPADEGPAARNEQDAPRRALSAGPALHEGAPRAIRRSRCTRRQRDASRHLRPRARRRFRRWALLQAADDVRRHRRETDGRRGLRRARPRARRDQGPAGRTCRRPTSPHPSATSRSTSFPPWIRPEEARVRRPSTRGESCAACSSTARTTRWSPTSSTSPCTRARSTSTAGTCSGR